HGEDRGRTGLQLAAKPVQEVACLGVEPARIDGTADNDAVVALEVVYVGRRAGVGDDALGGEPAGNLGGDVPGGAVLCREGDQDGRLHGPSKPGNAGEGIGPSTARGS